METESGPVADVAAYDAIRTRVASVFHLEARFPDQAFRVIEGSTIFVEFEALFDPDFWPALQSLASSHGDGAVDLLVVEPEVQSYYLPVTATYPAVSVAADSSADDYWVAVSAPAPSGDDGGALVYSATVVAVTGSSGRWGCWGERDIGVAAIRGIPGGVDSHAWQERFGPFLPAVDALEGYIALNFPGSVVPEDFSSALKENYP